MRKKFGQDVAHSDGLMTDFERASFFDTGDCESIEVTLNATPGTVTILNIPDEVKGIKVYPRTDPARFKVNDTVAAVGASALADIPTSAFGLGGILKADRWEARLLPMGVSRYVTFIGAASAVIDVEVF